MNSRKPAKKIEEDTKYLWQVIIEIKDTGLSERLASGEETGQDSGGGKQRRQLR